MLNALCFMCNGNAVRKKTRLFTRESTTFRPHKEVLLLAVYTGFVIGWIWCRYLDKLKRKN